MSKINRCILIVADSVGAGAAKDAHRFNDQGSDTLGNIAKWCVNNSVDFQLPVMGTLGLGKIANLPLLKNSSLAKEALAQALLEELSPGKDTTTGHWEIAGNVLNVEFPIYPNGFPKELLDKWALENNLPGYLCNQPASGTEVIEKFGPEHLRSGKPIVYTSGDSVWQIAASEETFGLQKLLAISKSARKYADELGLGRVIARPFTGKDSATFKRTENRKDYSTPPPSPNLLDALVASKKFVAGIGKIDDIFANRSLTDSDHTGRNETSMIATLKMMKKTDGQSGLIFANYIDFDMLWGHRRNPGGYAKALMELDQFLPSVINESNENDLIILTADHGNDPTHGGTDHTREDVPLLVFSKNPALRPIGNLGQLKGFHTIGRLVLEALGISVEQSKIVGLQSAPKIWSALNSTATGLA